MRKMLMVAMLAGAFALAGCRSDRAEDAAGEAEAEGELDDASAEAPSGVIETDDEASEEESAKPSE